MNPLEADYLDAGKRRYYSVRLVALCCAISAVMACLISLPVVLILQDDLKDNIYNERVSSCVRGNVSRGESNARAPFHRKDASNLSKLSTALADTRLKEASTFEAIGEAFDIQKEVEPLIEALKAASATDAGVAADERQVKFDNLPLRDCENVKRP